MKMIFEPTLSEVQQCARICHEVNRAYSFSIGDSSQAHWYNATDEQKMGAIAAVKAHLSSGLTVAPEQLHNEWCAQMKDKGWKLGELDREKKRTPNLMPYNRLPPEEQTKYRLFRASVHAFFHSHFEEVK
jgi:hypothetical protein